MVLISFYSTVIKWFQNVSYFKGVTVGMYIGARALPLVERVAEIKKKLSNLMKQLKVVNMLHLII